MTWMVFQAQISRALNFRDFYSSMIVSELPSSLPEEEYKCDLDREMNLQLMTDVDM